MRRHRVELPGERPVGASAQDEVGVLDLLRHKRHRFSCSFTSSSCCRRSSTGSCCGPHPPSLQDHQLPVCVDELHPTLNEALAKRLGVRDEGLLSKACTQHSTNFFKIKMCKNNKSLHKSRIKSANTTR